MKTYFLVLSIACLAGAIFYDKESQQCIPASGGFITEICADDSYTNDVRFTFTGGATDVFWTFGFEKDTAGDKMRRILDDANNYFNSK